MLNIAIIGKFTGQSQSYISITDALFAAGNKYKATVDVRFVSSIYLNESNII